MPHAEKKPSKQGKPSPTFKKTLSPAKDATTVELRTEAPKVRYLKVQPFHRERTIDSFHYEVRKVPQLRLCGDWLEAAGFPPEAYVSVTVMDGLLIIRAAQMDGQGQGNG